MVHIKPRKRLLDGVHRRAPTQQHEVDHNQTKDILECLPRDMDIVQTSFRESMIGLDVCNLFKVALDAFFFFLSLY